MNIPENWSATFVSSSGVAYPIQYELGDTGLKIISPKLSERSGKIILYTSEEGLPLDFVSSIELIGNLQDQLFVPTSTVEHRYKADREMFYYLDRLSDAESYLNTYLAKSITQQLSILTQGQLLSTIGHEPLVSTIDFQFRENKLHFSLDKSNPLLLHIRIQPRVQLLLASETFADLQIYGDANIVGNAEDLILVEMHLDSFSYGSKTQLDHYSFPSRASLGTRVIQSLKRGVRRFNLQYRLNLAILSLISYSLGSLSAWNTLVLFLVGFFALLSLNVSANLFNDFFDHLSKNDAYRLTNDYSAQLSGGSRFIQSGIVSPTQTLLQGLYLLLIGGSLGLILLWQLDTFAILYLGLLGAFFAFFYSSPPLKFAYRGLGEITILLAWSILPFLGGHYVQALNFKISREQTIILVVLALHVFSLILLRNLTDLDLDRATGKQTLAVLLGEKRIMSVVERIVPVSIFLLLILLSFLHPPYLLSFGIYTLTLDRSILNTFHLSHSPNLQISLYLLTASFVVVRLL